MSTLQSGRAPRGTSGGSRGSGRGGNNGARRIAPAPTINARGQSIHAPRQSGAPVAKQQAGTTTREQAGSAARGQRGLARSRYASSATRQGAQAGRGARQQGGPPSSDSTVSASRDPRKAASKSDYMKSMADAFQQLKERRDNERKAAIRDGFMADPDKKTSLAEAITPVGTCQDMCPEFERVERVVQMMVDRCERKQTDDGSEAVPWEPFMIKRFRRSAAGTDDQIPSDIRPPPILKRTLDYLLDEVVGGPQSLATVHKFVWDRTRAIRNDFSIQQVTKAEDLQIAIECFERIARFHLLSLHQLSRPDRDNGGFEAHQEREQLGNTLLSLMYYYDDSRSKINSPNEPEFRAYCIIFEIQDRRPDLQDRVQMWPKHLLQHPRVQTALRLYSAASNTVDDQGPLMPRASFAVGQANHGRFWSILSSPAVSYLDACAAEVYFNHVRSTALQTIYKAFRRPTSAKMDDLTLEALMYMLGFDNEDDTEAYCEDCGLVVKEREDGNAFIDLNSLPGRGPNDSQPNRGQTFSKRIVEAKRRGRTLPAVVRGFSVAKARAGGFIQEESEDEGEGQDDDLFIHDDDTDTAIAAAKQPFGGSSSFQSTPTAASSTNPFALQTQAGTRQDNPPHTKPSLSESPPKPIFGTNPFAQSTQSNPFAAAQSATNPFAQTSPSASGSSSNQQPSHDTSTAPKNPFLPISNQEIAANIFGPKSNSSKSEVSPFAPKGPTSQASQDSPTAAFSNPFAKSAVDVRPDESTAQASEAAKPAAQRGTGVFQPQLTPTAISKEPKFQIPPEPQPSFLATSSPSTEVKSKNDNVASVSNADTSRSSLFPAGSSSISAETTSSTFTPPPKPAPSLFTPKDTPTPSPQPPSSADSQAASGIFGPKADTRPKKSSPLSGPALTPSSPRLDTFEQAKSAFPESSPRSITQPQPVSPATKKKALDGFAHQMFLGQGGILEMFIETLMPPIFTKAQKKIAREIERQAAAEARAYLLQTKYGRRWKKITWSRNLARKGRERRKALAQTLRSSAASSLRSSMSPVERPLNSKTFDSSLFSTSEQRTSTAHATALSSALDHARMPPPQIHKTSHSTPAKAKDLASISEKTQSLSLSQPERARNHKRSHTVSSFSTSTHSPRPPKMAASHSSPFKDKSFQSRVLGNQSLLKQARRLASGRVDTTQTDYFRLKALGLDPDTPKVPQTRKRTRSTDSTDESPRKSTRASPPPMEPPAALLRMRGRTQFQPTTETNTPAKAAPLASSKPSKQDDDEELFARVRKVRQAMADSETWFKSTRESEEREASCLRAESMQSQQRRSDVSTPSRASLRIQETGAHGLWDRWQKMVAEREESSRADSREDSEEEREDDIYGDADDQYENDEIDLEEEDDADAEGDDMDLGLTRYAAGKLRGGNVQKGVDQMNGFERGGTSVEDAIEL